MGDENKKKRMREIRCVSRTTGVQFLSLSLSLSQTPSAVLPTAGHIPVFVVCVFHSRTNVVSSGLPFFVTLYLCLCLCLTRDDLEMRFRAQVHV